MSDPSRAGARFSGPFAALRFRDFRLFWIGQLISQIGDWMQMTAVSWLLYDLTGSAFQLGINGIFRAVPMVGLGLIAGAIADRYDRRRLLLALQLLLMAQFILFGILVQVGLAEAWHIYALTFTNGVMRTLEGPARQAMFPALIPRSALANAVALNSVIWKGTMLVGPSLAGITISVIGIAGTLYVNAASFLAVVFALLWMSPSVQPARAPGPLLGDLKEGLAYVTSQKTIGRIMIMEAISSLFGFNTAILTIFARDIFAAGPSGFGFLQSARGVGGIFGSTLVVSLGAGAPFGKIMFISGLLYGLGFASFGLAPSFGLGLGLMALVGFADAVWGATRSMILQLQTPDALRGRVMGVFSLSSKGMQPLGQVETGLVVPLIGARVATVLGGLVVSAAALLTLSRSSALRHGGVEEKTAGMERFPTR